MARVAGGDDLLGDVTGQVGWDREPDAVRLGIVLRVGGGQRRVPMTCPEVLTSGQADGAGRAERRPERHPGRFAGIPGQPPSPGPTRCDSPTTPSRRCSPTSASRNQSPAPPRLISAARRRTPRGMASADGTSRLRRSGRWPSRPSPGPEQHPVGLRGGAGQCDGRERQGRRAARRCCSGDDQRLSARPAGAGRPGTRIPRPPLARGPVGLSARPGAGQDGDRRP